MHAFISRSRSIDQIIAFDKGCLFLTNSFLDKPIAIIHILLKKLNYLDYIFVADSTGLSATDNAK